MALGETAPKTIRAIPQPPQIPKVKMSLYIGDEELDRFWRFQKRTVLSLGTLRGARIFQKFSTELAFKVRPLRLLTK